MVLKPVVSTTGKQNQKCQEPGACIISYIIMKLQLLDILILLTYLATMIFIGFWMRKKAKQSKESYLLGGKTLPWYMLGLSDASDMFDISGTMWMVAL